MFQRHSRAEGPHFVISYTFFVFYWFLLKSDYREFQYCIPDAGDGYNLGTASGTQISECLNPAVARYVITWARFELCPRYKSPSSVTRRGASIGLTWLAGRPKPEFPPLLSASRLGRVLGEGGVKSVKRKGQKDTELWESIIWYFGPKKYHFNSFLWASPQ